MHPFALKSSTESRTYLSSHHRHLLFKIVPVVSFVRLKFTKNCAELGRHRHDVDGCHLTRCYLRKKMRLSKLFAETQHQRHKKSDLP